MCMQLLFIHLFVTLVLLLNENVVSAYSPTTTSTFYLGGSFPVYRKIVGKNYTAVKGAIERMATFIAAVDAINADHTILPHTQIKYIMSNGQLDAGYTIEASVELMNIQDKQIGAVVGPATSGNSKTSAHVFNALHVPQISYSATSPSLSNDQVYKYFLRTAPHDLFQANVLIDFLEDEVAQREIISFSLLVGPGSYAESIGDIIKNYYNFGNTKDASPTIKLQLARFDHFRQQNSEDDTELKNILKEFLSEDRTKGGCHVYVLSAQSNDMKRVFDVANELGYNDDANRVQWILVESAIGSYGNLNPTSDFNALNNIIKGSVAITFPDGAGSAKYNNFKSKLQSLGKTGKLCEPNYLNNYCVGLDANQCSDALDANNKSIFYQDLPLDKTYNTPHKICLGMDFTNYQPTLYMPFTWDAVWAIAKGLHSVLYEKKTIANASILCKTANDRKMLYDELIQHVEFEGATGTVLFLNETKKKNNGEIADGEGDRDGNSFKWKIYVHESNGFEVYGSVSNHKFFAERARVNVRLPRSGGNTLPPLCYSPTSVEPVTNTVTDSDPTNTIVVTSVAIVVIVILVILHYIHNKRLREAHSDAWKIDKTQLNIIKTIGKGAYGTIYLGTYNSTNVAIKRFDKKTADTSVALDDFIAEFTAIVDLRHKNLVQFFGVVLEPVSLQHSIVTELMKKGDLANVLHDPDNEFSAVQLATFANDIALGLEYLHQQKPYPIVHCDLKTENILVDEHFVCKIADFGLTVVTGKHGKRGRSRTRSGSIKSLNARASFSFSNNEKKSTEGAKGSMLWLPPEVYSGGNYTKEGDVFALGLIISEICTLRAPFSNIEGKSTNQIQRECALENLRPNWGKDNETFPSLQPIFEVATEMWHVKPAERLKSTEICKRFGAILENLKNDSSSLRPSFVKQKYKGEVAIELLLKSEIEADDEIKHFEFHDIELFDSATTNLSGNAYHRLKIGKLKGDIGVYALSLNFRLGKKQKRIKANVAKVVTNLKQIAAVRHENFVQFAGVSHVQLSCIYLLYNIPAASNYLTLYDYINSPDVIFTMQDALKAALDVVNAMIYLHDQNMYHCNLSYHTIMIAADTKHILISRWENSLISCKVHEEESIILGNCGWESPENLILDHKGESCDVYSVGILLWYLMSCKIPFFNIINDLGDNDRAADTINRRIVNEKIRPNISIENIERVAGIEHGDVSYIEIISGCWAQKMDERVSLKSKVSVFLENCLTKEPNRLANKNAGDEDLTISNPLFIASTKKVEEQRNNADWAHA